MKTKNRPREWERGRTAARGTAAPKKEDAVVTCTVFRCWLAVLIIGAGALLPKAAPAVSGQVQSVYYTLLNAPLADTAQVWRQTAQQVGLTVLLGNMEESIMVYAGHRLEEEPLAQGGQQEWTEETLPDNVSAERPVFSVPAVHPASGLLSCGFGPRLHPITGSADFHTGIDIAAAGGSGVYAAWPGVVQQVGSSAIYGNFVTLDHGGGLTTTYCHCQSILAQQGAHLRAGERVATVGSTGISTGNHLHFEVRLNDKSIDPLCAFDL